MKQTTQLALFIVLVFGAITNAQAALLLEPVVGYSFAGKLDTTNGGKAYGGGRGPAYGGRVGFQKLGFQIGGDYLHSTMKMDGSHFKEDASISEWAGFVGFEFPILLRLYAGYIFSGTGKSEVSSGNYELKSLNGAKAGIGFTGLPLIDINFEYRRGTFDSSVTNGVADEANVDYQAYMIALSVPFTI